MKNKISIKNWAIFGLLAASIVVGLNFLNFQKTIAQIRIVGPTADENTIANFLVATVTTAGNTPVSGVRNDSDVEGNQIYVWAYQGTGEFNCSGIKYQIFNRVGIALTQPTSVIENCNNSFDYSSPDVAFTANGFTVVYNQRSTISEIQIMEFYEDGTLIFGPAPVNDVDAPVNPVVRVAADPENGSPIGVSWNSCRTALCDDLDVAFQNFDENSGTRVNPTNVILNTNTASGHTSLAPNISFGNTLHMVSWTQSDGASTQILARGVQALDSDNLTNILNISENQITAQESDIAGIHAGPDFGAAVDPINFTEKFFVTYSAYDATNNSQDIFIRKIVCDNTYDPDLVITTFDCAPTTRNSNEILVRASSSQNDDVNPAITAFQNYKYIQRMAPYENTSIDYLTVSWIERTGLDENILKVQSYTNTLKKTGDTYSVDYDIDEDIGYSLSTDKDGHYVINYTVTTPPEVCPPLVICPPSGSTISHAKIYPSKYLRIGTEKIVNAPSFNPEFQPEVAVNSDGNYVVVYTAFNGLDNNVMYTLYDRQGNPIKNTDFATQTTNLDQSNPHVEFFKDDSSSADFGKFVISWEGNGVGDDLGIYYRVFNADGTPDGGETLVNSDPVDNQYGSDLGVGKNGQMAITYVEDGAPNLVMLAYYDNTNLIRSTVDTSASAITNTKIGISPVADGSTNLAGKSKFAVGWNIPVGGRIREGYLFDSSTITFLPTFNAGSYVSDIDGGYRPEFATDLTVASEAFFYGYSAFNGDGFPFSNLEIFNSNFSTPVLYDGNYPPTISIDPATGNIMTIARKSTAYQQFWNRYQVLLSPADDPGNYTSFQHIIDQYHMDEADISDNYGFYAFITNFTNNFGFPFGNFALGSFTTVTPASIVPAQELIFSNDVTGHFAISQQITGSGSGATGTVTAVTPFYIVVELTGLGNFSNSDTLDNAPFNDVVTANNVGNDFYFSSSEGDFFPSGSNIINQDVSGTGSVLYSTPSMVFAFTTNGSFQSTDNVQYLTQFGNNLADIIGYPSVTISQLDIETIPIEGGGNTVEPVWTQAGPSFGSNHYYNYGHALDSVAIDYNTGSSDAEGQIAVAVYANSLSSTENNYIDSNGVFQQVIENPFTIGAREDLNPQTEQQINPGGKYIIVPQTIDFGDVDRNTTASVNFSELTPSCLQVTDLDGTDFDLTVSLTNLVNVTNNLLFIPNSNVILENNDGTSDPITSNYSFTNVSDVTLDPSTDIGQNANLGSTKTLLRKTNSNTGSWTICPKVLLNTPSNAPPGVSNGTMTFTLI